MLFVRIYAVFIFVLIITSAHAQPVRIGTVDVYGNQSVSTDTILHMVGLSKGDTISHKQLAERIIEKRLESTGQIRAAQTAVVCCDNAKQYVLFIGVAENESSLFSYRPSPNLKIALPEWYTSAYRTFTRRQNDAVLLGESEEDWSNGYSLIKYAPARRIQRRYLRWANSDFYSLQKILRSSMYDGQRATAVQIIAYNDDKRKVIPELIYAIGDEDAEVRNNAIKALSAISYYMTLHPGRTDISFQPFIRMINSLVWADRNTGLLVLMQLSQSRNKELFRQLRENSMRSLKEMAQWKSETHALPAYVILARMAGQSDDKIFAATSDGDFRVEAATIAEELERRRY